MSGTFKKLKNFILVSAILICAGCGKEEGNSQIILCTDMDVDGFNTKEKSKKYSEGRYLPVRFSVLINDDKSSIELKRPDLSFKQLLSCGESNNFITCTGGTNTFVLNLTNLHFTSSNLLGWLYGGGVDNMSISYGTCVKL
jgi:hypothetical protein